jgi:hypothetical protein
MQAVLEAMSAMNAFFRIHIYLGGIIFIINNIGRWYGTTVNTSVAAYAFFFVGKNQSGVLIIVHEYPVLSHLK